MDGEKSNNQLYWLFVIAIASDPIVNTIQSYYLGEEMFLGFQISFLQVFRGFILLLMLGMIIFKNITVFKDVVLIWPLLFLSLYALFVSPLARYPSEGLAWSFRVLYLSVIFIAAYILTCTEDINFKTIWYLAVFVLITYLLSQLLAIYTGHGGLTAYRTEFGSSGFGLGIKALSWAICGLVPCFFLHGNWRTKDVLMIMLAFFSILLTIRRSAFFALLIVILIIALFRLLRRRTGGVTKLLSLIIPTTIVLAFWYILNTTEFGFVFMKRLEDLSFTTGTASGRYTFQRIGLQHLFNRDYLGTIFGEGMGYSKLLLGTQLRRWINMHSDWLEISISYGLIGLTCFIFFLVGVFRLVLKVRSFRVFNVDAPIAIFLMMCMLSIASGGILDAIFAMPYATLGVMSATLRRNTYDGVEKYRLKPVQ
jgi:hypothetical protein